MAVKAPTLPSADASAAVQTSTVVDSPIPQVLATAGNIILEQNKQSKLASLKGELEEHRAGLEEAVLGDDAVVKTSASSQAEKDFATEASRLAKARPSLNPARFKSQAEMMLRKHIAAAPGLEQEFKGVARNVLKYDPTGAGLEEAFGLLAAQREQDAGAFNRFLKNVEAAPGGRALVGKFMTRQVSESDMLMQGTHLLDTLSQGERSKFILEQAETKEQLNSIAVKNQANGYVNAEALMYQDKLENSLSENARQELQLIEDGDLAKASKETVLEVQEFNKAWAEANDRILRGVEINMTPDQRTLLRTNLNTVQENMNKVLTGQVTGDAARILLENTNNSTMLGVTQNPELLAVASTAMTMAEFRMDPTVLFQQGAKGAQLLSDLVHGVTSVEQVRKNPDKEWRVSAEKMFHDWHKKMADRGVIVDAPETGQLAEEYIRDLATNISNAPTPGLAAQAVETVASATYLKLLNELPDKDAVQQQYKQEMSETGANTLGVVLDPIREEILKGDIEVFAEGGALRVPRPKEGARTRGGSNSNAQLVRKFNRIAAAYSKILDVDQQEFIESSFDLYVARRPELEQKLQALTTKLADSGGSDRSSQSRRRRIEQQIQQLQEQLERVGAISE